MSYISFTLHLPFPLNILQARCQCWYGTASPAGKVPAIAAALSANVGRFVKSSEKASTSPAILTIRVPRPAGYLIVSPYAGVGAEGVDGAVYCGLCHVDTGAYSAVASVL